MTPRERAEATGAAFNLSRTQIDVLADQFDRALAAQREADAKIADQIAEKWLRRGRGAEQSVANEVACSIRTGAPSDD